ncbi:hypothetical protein ES288_A07G214600v1 [Gossypium darwinii]|uniref:Uncharacterized protein n=3 Tax=Gossypium TaxID=3633 RepID=A0A5D2FZL0_GOSDA|nr:hypothetical protein ES288_A07G214600v1 [Gossypium darwinii]
MNTLSEEKLVAITNSSSEEDMLYHKQWERSNRLSLVFLRMIIANNIKATISQTESTKAYLMLVVENFHSLDKSLGTLMAQLITMKYDRLRGMQECIIEMANIEARIKTLGMMVDDSFLV